MQPADAPPLPEDGWTLQRWLTSEAFSCLGARAALRRGVLREGAFGRLAEPATTRLLHKALAEFVHNDLSPDEDFATFVAVFEGHRARTEPEYETLLWRQLTALHEIDAEKYEWAPGVSRDPASPDFAFSVAGEAFFVVGMHDNASRLSRRYHSPALAFNPHSQFQRLRREGVYLGLRQRIRERELRLQGSLKPNLADHGHDTEAKQYAGRAVEDGWRCPHQDAFADGSRR